MKRIFFGSLIASTAIFVACQSEKIDPEFDCSTSDLDLGLLNVTNASCGVSDGSVTLEATGGDGNYTYSISGSGDQEAAEFTGLAAGNYEFSVTDGNGCSALHNVSVENAGGVGITSVDLEPSGCDDNNGSVTVNASSGTEPYQYKLNGGDLQNENFFSGVTAGNHTVLVVDSDGCEFSENVRVLTGTSFDNHISPIISSNCAVSGCHNGDDASLPNFTSFSTIKNNAGSIRSMTTSGAMPPAGAGSLTDSEVELIACWVDDGALDN